MATGKVKWFNNAKGYGFVIAEAGGEDLFVHYSSIQMDGYKTLKAGQDVEFDIEHGAKGMHAVNIRSFDAACQRHQTRQAARDTDDDERPSRRLTQRLAAAQRIRGVPLSHIFATIAWPNCEHFSSLAPVINRSKSYVTVF